MLTGGVKTGEMKLIVEKYQTQGAREEFSHTERRHLNGAEMGCEADIGPRTNQGKPSLNHDTTICSFEVFLTFPD